jgi:DNA-binding Lrp family transcriptional regulator
MLTTSAFTEWADCCPKGTINKHIEQDYDHRLSMLPISGRAARAILGVMTRLDRTDARLLLALCDAPRATGVQLAARLNLARNTVQARLSRWDQEKVLAPIDRCVSPRDLGYPLTAFITAVVDQHRLDDVIAALATIAQITQVTGLSGAADLLIGVVATDADDLYRVAGLVLAVPGVERTTMSVAMHEVVAYRTRPLLEQLAHRQ